MRAACVRLLILTLGACARGADFGEPHCASAEVALFNGSPHAGTLPLGFAQSRAIGAIINPETGAPLCTVTRIGERHAITAGHCIAAPMATMQFAGQSGTLERARSVTHPNLDVALVEIGAELRTAMGDDAIALLEGAIAGDWIGRSVTLSGNGRDQNGGYGELRFVEERVVDVTAAELWVDGMGQSGACGGDSGGPLLVEDRSGVVRVAGTLDRGSPDCVGLDVYIRADVIVSWARAMLPEALSPPRALACD